MKKILTATFAILTVGAAYAMPTDSGEHTYSAQGPAIHVQVQPRVRNIPAPSSWTPPERIPSTPVTYVKRDQPKRLGGGFSFSTPTFSNPSFSNSSFSNPSFSNPSLNNPGFSNPSFSSPTSSSPSFGAPSLGSPSLTSPSFSNPTI